jgi:hypothetical protein
MITLAPTNPKLSTGPRPINWTRDQYILLGKHGLFNGRRVELIKGENSRVFVFRDPVPVAAGGTAYRTHLAFGSRDSIAPLGSPGNSIQVADLLP